MSLLIFTDKLSTVGQWMSSKLLLVSIEVIVFTLIVWIIHRVVRFRSARVREAFWLIVLFKMVLSLFIALPISLSFISVQNTTKQHILQSSAPLVEPNIRASSPQVSLTEASKQSQGVSLADKVSWLRQLNWQQGIAILWLLGCFLMLGKLVFGLRLLGKLRKNTQPAPPSLQQTLCSCKEQLEMCSSVTLQLADDIAAPILFGFLRPVIILPSWFVERFSQLELRLMLIHELAHWQYRDTWVLFAKRLIESFFFFHPAVWYAGKQVVKESEVACDELVVTLSKESKTYANCLMKIIQGAAGIKLRGLSGLAVGGTATVNRIRKLLEEGSSMFSTKIKFQTIIALVLVALLGLPAWLAVKGDSAESATDITTDNILGKNEYGVVVQGQGKGIKGEIHISDINYSAGNFWSRGIPAQLEKFMNENTQLHIKLIVQGGKEVYLSLSPEHWPEDLFKQPILLMSKLQEDKKVAFSSAEIKNLREYLIAKGGFLFIDDDTGGTGAFYRSLLSMLRLAFPEFPISPIPNDHGIYKCYYEMEGPPSSQESKKESLSGIFIGSRLAVLISDRGYWDALIDKDPHSPDVLRFCTNMVVYAITRGGIADTFTAVSEEVALFPDRKLGAAIRNALDKPKGPITEEDLAGLTVLMVKRQGISDLTGIEHCINLQALILDGNRIGDITPLSGLNKLQTLDLQHNTISNITPLSKLLSLQKLNLSHNEIDDISPLSMLKDLNRLILYDNKITDISHLSGLNNLQTLHLMDNEINDISPLSELTKLETLSLWDNKISDISSLSRLTNLQELSLGNNKMSDINSISFLTNLQKLGLGGNQISDISALSGLINLQSLDLVLNPISDFNPLSGLNKLQRLYLGNNKTNNVSPLSGLTNLQELGLWFTQINDITLLSRLTNLQELNLAGNQISDISPLSTLTNLRDLDLTSNRITDINPISGLTNLQTLGLRDNKIADISPLVNNKGISGSDKVDLRENPLNDEAYDIHIPALETRLVRLLFSPKESPNKR